MPAHASQLAEYLALKDITVMHAVVDTVGMNRLVRTLAINGANAISGMVERAVFPCSRRESPLLAITEFGFCDKGAHFVRRHSRGRTMKQSPSTPTAWATRRRWSS